MPANTGSTAPQSNSAIAAILSSCEESSILETRARDMMTAALTILNELEANNVLEVTAKRLAQFCELDCLLDCYNGIVTLDGVPINHSLSEQAKLSVYTYFATLPAFDETKKPSSQYTALQAQHTYGLMLAIEKVAEATDASLEFLKL